MLAGVASKNKIETTSILSPIKLRQIVREEAGRSGSKCFTYVTKPYPHIVKFKYSEKAITFCKISTIDLSYVVTIKSTVEISQYFVAFSEYMNFRKPGNYNGTFEPLHEIQIFFEVL